MTENDKTLVAWLHNEAVFAYDKEDTNILNEIAARIEALSAENERLREALAKSEALQDLAYYNGAKQYAAMSAQSENAARDWLAGGCGNRQRDAIAALGDTK